eukprot:9378734-Alexandrium_andersonii.AAC.1
MGGGQRQRRLAPRKQDHPPGSPDRQEPPPGPPPRHNGCRSRPAAAMGGCVEDHGADGGPRVRDDPLPPAPPDHRPAPPPEHDRDPGHHASDHQRPHELQGGDLRPPER